MTAPVQIEEATIKKCKILRMPIIASQCLAAAEQAFRENAPILCFCGLTARGTG
jgi:hypothetical protein